MPVPGVNWHPDGADGDGEAYQGGCGRGPA